MNLRYTFKTASDALRIHKSRSALTILGIVIGITSIIMMVSIGQGVEDLIVKQLGGFGADVIAVRPGREPTGPSDFTETLYADSLKQREVDALRNKNNVPDAIDIMPAVIVVGSVGYGNETYRPMIFGGDAEFFAEVFKIDVDRGTFFTELDIKQSSSVAVIGSKVKEELFGNEDAIGKNVKIKDRKMRVVGVLEDVGQGSFFNYNELVLVPYTTAQNYLGSTQHFLEIIVKASSPEAVDRTVHDIKATLRELHNITDPAKDDFFVVTQEGIVDKVRSILGALTAFLTSVIAIALVVAGIGVMNIMLVSVTERTREIGLRKALGATNGDIMKQFLLEAVILTAIGGLIGILFGGLLALGASIGLNSYLNIEWTFSFPYVAALMSVAMSSIVGLVFGLYPARSASKKSPIEALRYE